MATDFQLNHGNLKKETGDSYSNHGNERGLAYEQGSRKRKEPSLMCYPGGLRARGGLQPGHRGANIKQQMDIHKRTVGLDRPAHLCPQCVCLTIYIAYLFFMQRVGMKQALLEPVPTLARPHYPRLSSVLLERTQTHAMSSSAERRSLKYPDASKMRRFTPEGDRFRMQLRSEWGGVASPGGKVLKGLHTCSCSPYAPSAYL